MSVSAHPEDFYPEDYYGDDFYGEELLPANQSGLSPHAPPFRPSEHAGPGAASRKALSPAEKAERSERKERRRRGAGRAPEAPSLVSYVMAAMQAVINKPEEAERSATTDE